MTFGRAVRMRRTQKGWRQCDLAVRAGLSPATISRIERGLIGAISLGTIRRGCQPLELTTELLVRGRGADLDRLVNAAHSALHESVAGALLEQHPAWVIASEVSFNIYGERGIIDLLLWHPGRRALLIIELKTELVDPGGMLATMDRRIRLAGTIARERGLDPATVSAWIIVARSRTNERRLPARHTMLRTTFPADGRFLGTWLRDPAAPIRGMSLWSLGSASSTPRVPVARVRARGYG